MNPKQLQKMLQQAQKAQADMMKAQSELAAQNFTASVAGGKVTVVANGAGEVISIKIAKEVVDPEDIEILEDLILSGVNQAVATGKAAAESEMARLTQGLGLGGMGM